MGLLCLLTDRIDAELHRQLPEAARDLELLRGAGSRRSGRGERARHPVGFTPGSARRDHCRSRLWPAAGRGAAHSPRPTAFVRDGPLDPGAGLGARAPAGPGRRTGPPWASIGLGAIGRRSRAGPAASTCGCWAGRARARRSPGSRPCALEALLARIRLRVDPRGPDPGDPGPHRRRRLRPDAAGGGPRQHGPGRRRRRGRPGRGARERSARGRGPGRLRDRAPRPRQPAASTPRTCVLTPHIGSASIATRTRMADLAVENLLAGLGGAAAARCANPSTWAGTPAVRPGTRPQASPCSGRERRGGSRPGPRGDARGRRASGRTSPPRSGRDPPAARTRASSHSSADGAKTRVEARGRPALVGLPRRLRARPVEDDPDLGSGVVEAARELQQLAAARLGPPFGCDRAHPAARRAAR